MEQQLDMVVSSSSGASMAYESEDLKIHTSDFPGMVLVSTPLKRNNYLLWSRSVKVTLMAKMKLSFIDGSYPKPAENTKECKHWIRTDSMVFSWIMNSISKDIAKAFSYAKSARSLWLQLEARFGQTNGPMIYNLQREIASISQGNMDCVDPTPECTCASQRTVSNKIASTQLMQFLMGLNDSFSAIRSQILVMDPLPSVDKAYSLVLRVESQRQSSINIEELNNNAAMMIRGAEYRREIGALNATTSETAVGSQQEVLTQNLFAMMSELLQVMKGKTQSDPTQVHFARLGEFAAGISFNFLSNTLGPNLWIIDSGATAHMCANLQLMSNLKPYIADSSVILLDGTKHNVTHCGFVALSHDLSLNAVLHVPSFKHNLLSVSKLVSSSNIAFIFSRDNCVVQDQRTRRTLAVGRLVGSLYVLDSHSFDIDEIKKFSMKSKTEICLNAHSNDAVLWHRQLGHTPLLVLRHTNVISGSSCELGICNFPISGCTYMLTLVDDRSRATWVFLMKHKSQTMSFIEGFYQMVLTQFNKKIKIIRTDNGSEFVGDKCQSFIRNHGIIHQRTCVYSPQQNGVVERKHKHLLQVARALMFQSCLPSRFWTDAILTATYIINRLPTSVLHWKPPYEVLYNKAVDYSIVRTFGCLAFATNVLPHKSKFTKRAFRCVFVGYAFGQKGYKLYDLDDKVMLISRDVIFHENCFPYKDISESEHAVPLPISVWDDGASLGQSSPIIGASSGQSSPIAERSSTPVESVLDSHHTSPHISAQQHKGTSSVPVLRRSLRQATKPSWLNDFVCGVSDASATPHTVTFITPSHHAVMQAITPLREPTTYLEANASPEWRSAMQAELTALKTNKTWEVTPLPPNHTPIRCRWIFKLKFNTDGSIERYKARLVAKGYNQIEGIDYNECFSPVAKSVTVRLFFAVAAALRWHIHQLDINNAFLHGYLEEKIYMSPPEGYSVPQGHVCRLKHSLYGLKQASRQWNHEFTTQIVAFGFVQSKHDYCLFTKSSTDGFLVLLLYVDDILVAGIIVTQTKYIKDIMIDTGLLHARAATTPLPPGIKFTEDAGAQLPHPELYRRLVGRLLYLNFTRPNTSHACQQLSQFLQRPYQRHLDAALHLIRYLKGTRHKGLFFPSQNSLELRAYSDADWANCIDTRRSLTGYCIFLGDALVSWKTKKQNIVSRSTAEEEYHNMGSTVCELTWVVYLLMDFGISAPTPIPFFCDNQAALHIVNNPVFHERTKHLDIDCHIVRDKFKFGLINPVHVPGKAQLADFFTKSLPAPSFFLFLSKLGLVDFTPSPTCGGGG
ncbi:UNVERIFIED_CONTAM: Retrovirus-related Pol polyprotein from transposon RE1 [Sesamum indicum]